MERDAEQSKHLECARGVAQSTDSGALVDAARPTSASVHRCRWAHQGPRIRPEPLDLACDSTTEVMTEALLDRLGRQNRAVPLEGGEAERTHGHRCRTHHRRAPSSASSCLVGCVSVVEQARGTAGCLDFAITADLIGPGRVNIFETLGVRKRPSKPSAVAAPATSKARQCSRRR